MVNFVCKYPSSNQSMFRSRVEWLDTQEHTMFHFKIYVQVK